MNRVFKEYGSLSYDLDLCETGLDTDRSVKVIIEIRLYRDEGDWDMPPSEEFDMLSWHTWTEVDEAEESAISTYLNENFEDIVVRMSNDIAWDNRFFS